MKTASIVIINLFINVLIGFSYDLFSSSWKNDTYKYVTNELIKYSNMQSLDFVPCNMNVNSELDGDFRIYFYIDNNNFCHNNVEYQIDYGDGTSVTFVSNSNQLYVSHQYPHINKFYNVTITKFIIDSNIPNTPYVGDSVNLRVRATRD